MKKHSTTGSDRYQGPIQVIAPFGNVRKLVLSKKIYKHYNLISLRSVIQVKMFKPNDSEQYPEVDLYWIDDKGNRIDVQSEKSYHIYLSARTKDLPLQAVQKEQKSRDTRPTTAPFAHADKRCKGCNMKPIVGFCYSCIHCPDYHLCSSCVNMQHLEHNMVRSSRQIDPQRGPDGMCVDVHKDIQCDVCKVNPIQGFRYVCLPCWDLNLCKNCEKQDKHENHVVVRVPGRKFEPVVPELVNLRIN